MLYFCDQMKEVGAVQNNGPNEFPYIKVEIIQ